MQNNNHWKVTDRRFVAFFDILGFKDLVERNSHEEVLKKLYSLKSAMSSLEKASHNSAFKRIEMDDDQTKSVTFSDSIIVFSKSDQENDLIKIVYDAHAILKWSIELGIPIKGALAYGEITVDFEKSLFFGKPTIDAYLLHDELVMMTAIFHHSIEAKFRTLDVKALYSVSKDFKAYLKSGRLNHKLIRPYKKALPEQEEFLRRMYDGVSGRPRLYIDNTLEFLRSLEGE